MEEPPHRKPPEGCREGGMRTGWGRHEPGSSAGVQEGQDRGRTSPSGSAGNEDLGLPEHPPPEPRTGSLLAQLVSCVKELLEGGI